MHVSSYITMYEFFRDYVKPGNKVLDVGSKVCRNDKRGYRFILDKMMTVEYIGIDIEAGTNVDIVIPDSYEWMFSDGSFDIVISGQMLEHCDFFWLTFKEMARVLKPGGYMCLIVPSLVKEHRYPVDCWRFLPDGMRALAKWADVKCISARAKHFSYVDVPESVYDCVGVFQK